MRVLVACEYSGTVSSAFRARGHHVVSCDILQTTKDEGRPYHWIGDAIELAHHPKGWDLMIAHPPCTDLASIGASEWYWKQADGTQQRAIDFFMALYDAPIERVAVENPVGIMSRVFRQPDQYVQPWQYGDPWRKKTGLWLRGLEPLKPERETEPAEVDYWVGGQRGRTQQTHKAVNGKRSHERSKFFPGIARAMAEQWG